MTDTWKIEAAALYLPIVAATILLGWLVPHRRIRIGLVLTCGWQAATLPWVNLWANELGFWTFHTEGSALFGMPLSFYFGWIILWGLIVPLIAGRLPVRHPMWWVAAGALLLDLLTMPLLEPFLILGPRWILGEVALLSACLAPALVLAHHTFLDQNPKVRTLLISLAFTLLTLGVLPFVREPSMATFLGDFRHERTPWGHLSNLAIVIILGVPAMAGVREFATVGQGTPIPFDPPKNLVTTGIYAYLRNPMQTSLVATLLVWSHYLQSEISLLLAAAGVIYSLGFARWSEGADLIQKHGVRWQYYRNTVRPWLPNLFPCEQDKASVIFFDLRCCPCREVARWFSKHQLISLELADTATFKGPPLLRVTYRYPDGTLLGGVEAIAAALSHLHLGWAWLGWLIRLPIILPLSEIAFGNAFSNRSRCELDI